MSDPFEIVADAEEERLRTAQPSVATGGDPYAAVADAEVAARDTALSNTLRQVTALKPDQVAQERALAKSSGLPVPTVQRNSDLVANAERVRELLTLAKDSPILGRQLLDPNFGAIAHDDAESLGAVEKTLGALNRGLSAIVAGAGPRASAGLWSVVRAGAEMASSATGGRFGEGIAYRAKTESEKLGRMAALMRGGEDKPGFVEGSIYAGLESLGMNLVTMPLGVLARSANAALLPMSAITGGQEYEKARDKGKDAGAAFNYALSQATVEYFTEKLPMGKLLGDLKAGTPFWKTVLHQAALEVPGEQVATLLQDLNEWAVLKPQATFKDYLAERPSAAAQTLIATLVSVGGQTAVAAGAEAVARRLSGDLGRAHSAEENAAVFAELQKLAAASKLNERDPQTFGEFVQAAADEGPVDAVWVGGKELLAVLEQTGVDATVLPASVREQLPEAAMAGSDVRIPLGEFASAEAKLGEALLPHLKTSPDAFSQSEAQVYMQTQAERLQAEVTHIMATEVKNVAMQAEVELVRQHFEQQLAAANRFTPDVNTAYSTLVSNLYTTMAHRLGITPTEMLARYPLRVAAENVAGDVVMEQAGDADRFFDEKAIASARSEGRLTYMSPAEFLRLVQPEAASREKSGKLKTAVDAGTKLSDLPSLTIRTNADGSTQVDVHDGRHRARELMARGVERMPVRLDGDTVRGSIRGQGDNYKNTHTLSQSAIPPTLTIDGVLRPTTNSKNQPIASTREAIENFWRWFGDSKVVDAEGRPLVVYHGTNQSFDVFDTEMSREDGLIFLSSSNESASDFAMYRTVWGGANVVPVYAKIEDPLSVDGGGRKIREVETSAKVEGMQYGDTVRTVALRGGHDGIAFKNVIDDVGPRTSSAADVFAVFSPTQIKSAIGNAGTFDANDPSILNQPAYHGSPHDFDRFSTDKIGTGEGAQAYGWGLYFAENPGVAKEYQRNLSDASATTRFIIDGKVLDRDSPERHGASLVMSSDTREIRNTTKRWLKELKHGHPDVTAGMRDTAQQVGLSAEEYWTRLDKFVQTHGKRDIKVERGSLYQVDIPDEAVARMLDWDKPLSEQAPEVLESIKDVFDRMSNEEKDYKKASLLSFQFDRLDKSSPGETLYKMLSGLLGGDPAASQALLREGIPGIKYDDAGSRGVKANKTRNLVVFDDKIVKLTHKDGKPVTQAERDAYFQEVQSQPARGQIAFGADITASPSTITLLKNADLSTFLHELGHFQLEVLSHIAAQPNAPQEIVADFNRLLEWFKVPDAATWRTMSLEEKRPYHEKFARGFEAYLFEGKTPNVEIQSIFARFAAWLKHVYKSLTALNVELSDEVRGVMDRMIASEAAIATAEIARGYAPAFATKPESMSDDEWRAYQALGADATESATDDLQRRSLRDMRWASNARGRALAKLQAEADAKRKAIRAEVAAEVGAEPVYAAQTFMKGGGLPDGTQAVGAKMSTEALRQMYGEDPAAPWRYLPTNLVSTDTDGSLHPDTLAEMFGFKSGDQLVRAILESGPMQVKVDAITDQRMLDRYGDLSDEQAIERAADEAVHNEARGRFVATELKALSKATGQPRLLAKAAKSFAEATLARKVIREIRPEQYNSAEARAARAANTALAKNNLVEAATEKRNQLINHYAARAAYDAQEYVEKSLRKLKKLAANEGTRKALDPEYIEQIDAILERFDLKAVSAKELARRVSLRDWVAKQQEMGLEPDIEEAVLAEANRQNYSTLTLEEFRGVVDAVRNIEHLGQLKKKLLTAKDQKEFDAVVSELSNSVRDHATGTVAERRASDRGPLVSIGKLARRFFVEHRKFASLAREMDGWKDAGPMWERLVRTMNDAGNYEAVEREKATISLTKLLAPILKAGNLGKKTDTPQVGQSFTREERLGIALNMGNEVNRERVLTGEKWSVSQLQAVLDPLTAEDWQFVQGVWDYIATFREAVGEKQKRVTGFAPEWVESAPVQTKYGVLPGGYYPIKYDPERSTRAEADDAAAVQKQIERGLYARAQTRRGHLKERTESTGRPMRYDLGVITQHVDQVIHDLAWHEFLIDANRLLNAKPLDSAIREHYGPDKLATMRDMLRDIAVGDLAVQSAGDRILNHLRHGATIAGLGWNVATSLLQPLGLTQSVVRIGAVNVLRGIRHWAGDAASLESSYKKISEKSDFMRLRGKTMQREISEIRNKVRGKDSAVEASYFYLIQKMQQVADVPTWWGAYEKAMNQNGMNEAKAVALADQAVIDAQGAGQTKDLAQVQRGSAAWRLFTNFYSYFSTTYNLTRESVGRTNFKSVGSVAMLAADLALLYTIPALLSSLLKATLKGDWDDEEKLARRMISDQVTYLLGTVVILREAGAAVQGAFGLKGADYSGPASVRFFDSLSNLAKQAGQGEADAAFWKALNDTAGTIFHYPAGQINKTAEGVAALANGDTQNPGVLVAGPRH